MRFTRNKIQGKIVLRDQIGICPAQLDTTEDKGSDQNPDTSLSEDSLPSYQCKAKAIVLSPSLQLLFIPSRPMLGLGILHLCTEDMHVIFAKEETVADLLFCVGS